MLIGDAADSAVFREASAADRSELLRLDAYAKGMQAFLEGRYRETMTRLSEWLEGAGAAAEPTHSAFALAAVRRIPELVNGESAAAPGPVVPDDVAREQGVRALQMNPAPGGGCPVAGNQVS